MAVDQIRLRWLAEMNNARSAQAAEDLTLGYVTQDVSDAPLCLFLLPPISRTNNLLLMHHRNAAQRSQETAMTRPTSQ